jgi:hypothetical protein
MRVNVTLQQILDDPRSNELFEEFLLAEFSVEHLLFVREVIEFKEKWKKIEDPRDENQWKSYVEHCTKIYNDYCDEKCLAPVNVSHQIRSATTIEINKNKLKTLDSFILTKDQL